MKIQTVQNNSTNFKAGYPIVHWIREAGKKSYAPAISQKLNEKLQRSLVRMLNSDVRKAKPEKAPLIIKLKGIISKGDSDFAYNPIVRSFYNSRGGWIDNRFEPFGYILTGSHAEHLSETLGKPIGRAKKSAPRFSGEILETAEVNLAVNDYICLGLNYAKKLASYFKNSKNIGLGLHTKFEVVRTKTGKIKEFRFEDAKFCPEGGSENPFVRTGYIKE